MNRYTCINILRVNGTAREVLDVTFWMRTGGGAQGNLGVTE